MNPALDLHNPLAVILDSRLSDRFQKLLVLAYGTHLTETFLSHAVLFMLAKSLQNVRNAEEK
jgi:hypothetical protein